MKNLVAISAVLVSLVGCGQAQDAAVSLGLEDETGKTSAVRTMATPVEAASPVSVLLRSAKELPACEIGNEGALVYLVDEARFLSCSEGSWLEAAIKGERGGQGERGEKGDRGEAGPQGEKGERGETGAQGVQGVQGEKGETGATGAAGRDGVDGAAGVAGRDGVDGQDGTDNRLVSNQYCVHPQGSDILQWQVAKTVAGDTYLRVARSTLAYTNDVAGWFKAGEVSKLKMYWVESNTLVAYTYEARTNSLGNLELLRCRFGTDCAGGFGNLYGCTAGQ